MTRTNTGDGMADSDGLTGVVQAITATGALGTAAFGLVDATKALGGGVSNVGYRHLKTCLGRYSEALTRALGPAGDWKQVVKAHWLDGRPREEQKSIIRSLIRLGLSRETADQLARSSHVDLEHLRAVADKVNNGEDLTPQDVNLLGRLDASIDAHIDAAFDRAEQQYKNVARFLAAVFSVALALWGAALIGLNNWPLAVLVGLAAVPVAPVAKDLASSLSTAVRAVKAAKAL